MSIKSTCPHCGESVTVPDQLLGKKVRCKKCQETFLAEDLDVDDEKDLDEEDDDHIQPEPRSPRTTARSRHQDEDEEDEPPRRKSEEKSAAGLILMILGGVAAFLLLACCLPTGYFAWQFKRGWDNAMAELDHDFRDEDIDFPPNQPPNWPPPVKPPDQPVVPPGPFTIDDALADLKALEGDRRRRGADWLKRAPVDFGRQVEVTGALEQLLADADDRTRTSGMQTLAVWAIPQNGPALLKVLTQEKDSGGLNERQRLAMSTLGRLKDARAAAVIAPYLANAFANEDARKALQSIGPPAEKEVLRYYNHPDSGARDRARTLLQGYGTNNRALVAQSVEDLKSSDLSRRRSAVEWFGQAPVEETLRPAVAQALDPLLTDNDLRLSESALRALAIWGTKDNVPALLTLLPEAGVKGRTTRVRHQIMELLSKLRDERAIPPLAQRLTVVTDRTQASAALQPFGPAAAKEVAKYLDHPDRNTREEAARLLKSLGGNLGADFDLTRHLNGLKGNDVVLRREALNWFIKAPVENGKRPEVAQVLQARLQDPDAGTRELAIKALVVWGGKEDAAALFKMADDSSTAVRHLAIDVLSKMKDQRAAGAIAQRVPSPLDRDHASKALQAMGAMAEPDVINLLNHQDRLVRLEACKILRVIGTRASLAPLQTAGQNAIKLKQKDVAEAAALATTAINRRS